MAHRPNLVDIRSPSHDTLRSGIPSPRIEHFDGEVPPALSPLDAFAAQGRLLARQLEESARRDRRLSRLPPSSVARSLSRPRPGYFRSLSSGDGVDNSETSIERRPTQKGNAEFEEHGFRPVSEHPRFSNVSNPYTEASYCGEVDEEGDEDTSATPKHGSAVLQSGSRSLDVPRAESPEEDLSLDAVPDQGPRRFYAAPAPSVGVSLAAPSMNSSTDSASSRFLIPRSLAPPGSPFSRPSSSSKATHPESSDDDYSSSNAGSTFSKPRKLSSGSAMSVPHSPMSTTTPMPRSRPRSPSQSSEASNNGNQPLQRPSLNFSRPISRSSTNLSASAIAAAAEQPNQSNRASMDRGVKLSPIAVSHTMEKPRPSMEEPSSAVSSYTYAKYALPRGRQVSRDSTVFAGLQPNFEWREPLFEDTPPNEGQPQPPQRPARTPSPPPSQDETVLPPKARSLHETPMPDRGLLTPEPTTPSRRSPSPESTKSTKQSPKANTKDDASSSAASSSTLRPQTARSTGSAKSSSIPASAEDHLAVGIKCHEKGSLNESTYHLRVAAKQNHPTAMLLYALACRHGWGMRPNQTEGVRWLRKAVDSVGLEMMEDKANNTSTPARFREMQKAYRAQFALSIYELGVSHLNGWGIEQDKALALRCFELAGQWGDADAMAEAGYCYAQGVGCKKDLKKAAKFYREAESKGINMVGNSWYVAFNLFHRILIRRLTRALCRIYKDKYMSDDESNNGASRGRNAAPSDKKSRNRSKSRTRSLFHRKKSVAAEA